MIADVRHVRTQARRAPTLLLALGAVALFLSTSATVPARQVPGDAAALQVVVTASPAEPAVGESVTLSADIANAPADSDPSYAWEADLAEAGNWHPSGTDATLSFLANQPESWAFRVTVAYDSGASATSEPLTVTWTEASTAPRSVPDAHT
ncbi:MAG: hypothetical protein OXL97_01180 [Chloroflexota bacterium]|nr:hypothetical protein [Chloroflexota bacterium]MDE2884345.1 hypothetical protein [Chloroflexota bacterium]